jgi:hypothetical protein
MQVNDNSTRTGIPVYDFPNEVVLADGSKRPVKGCTQAEYNALWDSLPNEKRTSLTVPFLQRAGFMCFVTDEYAAVVGGVRDDDAEIITSYTGPCPPHNWKWTRDTGNIACTKCGEITGTMSVGPLRAVEENTDHAS